MCLFSSFEGLLSVSLFFFCWVFLRCLVVIDHRSRPERYRIFSGMVSTCEHLYLCFFLAWGNQMMFFWPIPKSQNCDKTTKDRRNGAVASKKAVLRSSSPEVLSLYHRLEQQQEEFNSLLEQQQLGRRERKFATIFSKKKRASKEGRKTSLMFQTLGNFLLSVNIIKKTISTWSTVGRRIPFFLDARHLEAKQREDQLRESLQKMQQEYCVEKKDVFELFRVVDVLLNVFFIIIIIIIIIFIILFKKL